ncbi:hypothetical protein AWH62_00970 [Maricaulis sp. W15]|uniref:Uncharacterized protein n=1 Tax=Maricaulis maris TaxID=74318 RepID=A0A495DKV5_9PROT|nr:MULTISPECIES: hypothetical protein [Maricaulis]OLF81278.1 hypothetical protein AWH62_00970 [Maricaulis sp. W15]RKR03573.1 hypothetical protein C7435_0009 [Maricaulis maris]
MNTAPFEIIAGPIEAYIAPVGTAFPAIDAAPAGPWALIGATGSENYDEQGVKIAHSQDVKAFKSLGLTGAKKAFRENEGLTVGFTLFDLQLEQYSLALAGTTVATTAAGVGTAGSKALPFYRGHDVALHALLLRGAYSPYGDAMNLQYQMPVCYLNSSPEPVFKKGDPAGLAFEYMALVDPSAATAAARFGQLVIQHQAPLEE